MERVQATRRWRARRRWLPGLALALASAAQPLAAQRAVTLEEAVGSALQQGPRSAIARADSAAAAARVLTARQLPSPALVLEYTKDPPQNHVSLEEAFEYPWARSARTGAARAEAQAAAFRLDLERARIRYDVTAAYAEASAARQIMTVSHQTVADGEELVRIASVRRDAGDASDLDVDLATLNAAQQRSTLYTDSLALITAALRLQVEMGLPVDSVMVTTADSMVVAPGVPPAGALEVVASEAEQRGALLKLSEERAGRLPELAARVGFDQGDPNEDTGLLPVAGLTVTVPIGRKGPIAEAQAAVRRAEAALALARSQADLARLQGERTRLLAQGRLDEDRIAVAAAQRVASRSLTAYSEGEYSLTAVIEAQRSARDAIRQYLDDLSALWSAQAAAELATMGGVLP